MIQEKYILGIETSCDDTSVALVRKDAFVLAQKTITQDSRHKVFGGVVPEIASRAHAETLMLVIDDLLKDSEISMEMIEALAVTNRPGLLGSLIVGVVTAKTLSQVFQKPLLPVNHLEGHILAPFLWDEKREAPSLPLFPHLVLAVSGGHTSLYLVKELGDYIQLGTTRDDAAGEAFDKFAKMAGLGFPGGAKVDQFAKRGDKNRFPFTITKLSHYGFSFSGIKSAAERRLNEEIIQSHQDLCDLAASYQESIVESLLLQTEKAINDFNPKAFLVTGGVSANSRLRERAKVLAEKKSLPLLIPELRYCTDNASMIALAGWQRLRIDGPSDVLNVSVSSQYLEKDFKIWNS